MCEAVHRLLLHKVEVEVTIWSFAVMVISIVVDVSRSRVLARTAKKYHSQALEADALHFQTDVWSSAVVILDDLRQDGRVCPVDRAGCARPTPWRRWEYPSSSSGSAGSSAAAPSTPWSIPRPPAWRSASWRPSRPSPASNCHNIRARYSGPVLFIDLHVLVDGDQTLFEAHALTETIEGVIQQIVPARRRHGPPRTVLSRPASAVSVSAFDFLRVSATPRQNHILPIVFSALPLRPLRLCGEVTLPNTESDQHILI